MTLKKSLTEEELKIFQREDTNPGTRAARIILFILVLFALFAGGLFS